MYTLILIFYIVTAALTCFNQLHDRRIQCLLARIDIFRLLPIWTFFAPNPGVSDYHLLYRVMNGEGELSPFTSVRLSGQKCLLNAIWNPHKRSQKALSDLVQEIRYLVGSGAVVKDNQHLIKLSMGYILTLHYCTELNRALAGSGKVQFIVLESFGFHEAKEPRLILNSDFHTIL